ncbi:hypothetical protein [Nocardia sp. NPDC003183]
MQHNITQSGVWQHFTAGLILIGVSTTGSVDTYREYTRYRHINEAVDLAEWDWHVPDEWFDQASS